MSGAGGHFHMQYTNITPEKKFGAVTIRIGQQVDIQVMQLTREAVLGIPVQARLSALLPLFCYRLLLDNGEVNIARALADAGWVGASGGDPDTYDEITTKNESSNPNKGLELVNNTLALTREIWPFDYQLAESIMHSRTVALYAVAPGAISDTDRAFAPEGSTGFVRELGIPSLIGGRPQLTKALPGDPVEAIMSILMGKSSTAAVDYATLEEDFPVEN